MNYFRCGGGRSTHTATKIDVAKTPLATFESNVSGLYLPEILAYIQATQSGTGDPNPSNPRAINGVSAVDTTVCGVNLWDEQWEVGAFNNNGEKIPYNYTIRSKNKIKASGSCYFKFPISTPVINIRLVQYDENMNCLSSIAGTEINKVITLNANCRYIAFNCSADYGTTYNNDISINYPATATAYEPYTGQTATTALGDTYYGGYLNVTTGVLTVTHLGVDMGSLGWTYNATDNYFNVSESRIKSDTIPEVMCEQFTYRGRGSSSTMSTAPTDSIYYFTNALRVKDTRFTDANAFVTAVTGQKVMFELKETAYETYQLTPAQIEQLLGQNNVFCSTGDVAVKYWKID